MMLDDESLLSAFLDGELDPASRLEVVSVLLTNPRLAEELHELACVRELLANLPRPGLSRDLADEVVERLGGRRALWPSRRAFPTAIAAAAAFAIAMPLVLRWYSGREGNPPARPVVAAGGSTPAPKSPQEAAIVAEGAGPGRPGVEETPKVPAPEIARVAPGDDDPEAKAREADQAHIRKLLDDPNLRRVFVVTDVIGGDASGRVDELLQQTARGERRYGRITISQGIVIDPKHPDQATVFALVLNDLELRQLRERLTETFPGNVEESVAEPSVVTQLADIGHVAVLSGIAASELTIPDDRVAIRHPQAGEKVLEGTRDSRGADPDDLRHADLIGSDDPRRRGTTAHFPQAETTPRETAPAERAASSAPVATREQPGSPEAATALRGSSPSDEVRSSPDSGPERPGSVAATGGGGRDDAERRGKTSIVLVWVTTRERRGGDPPSGGPGGRTLEPRGAGG